MNRFWEFSIIIFATLFLVACSGEQEKITKPITEPGVAEKVTPEEEKISNPLGIGVMQEGQQWSDFFAINDIDPQESGYYIVEGNNVYGDVYGVLNEELEWVIEPNFEIADISSVSNGMIAVAVWDGRPTRAGAEEGDNLLWGFVNEQGEWAIEPTYREVGEFSESLAFALTIEEDRDDLSNSRGIIINEKGEEVAEVAPSKNYKDYSTRFEVEPKFLNGTMEVFIDDNTPHIIVDSKGNTYDFPKIQYDLNADSYAYADYYVNGYNVYEVVSNDELSPTKTINAHNIQTKKVSSTSVQVNGYTESYTTVYKEDFFRGNKLFALYNSGSTNSTLQLYNMDGKKAFKHNISASGEGYVGEDWVLYEQSKGETEDEELVGFVYINKDGTEKTITLADDMEIAHFKDLYWENGTEYAMLKNFDGDIILGEEYKIFMDEIGSNVIDNDGYLFNTVSSVIVSYREGSDSTNILQALVNLETGEFKPLDYTVLD